MCISDLEAMAGNLMGLYFMHHPPKNLYELHSAEVNGQIHDQNKRQYFEAQKWRPIFDKIFDVKLPTHVPSNYDQNSLCWKCLILIPDTAVAVALVLAKCSPYRTEFLIKILTGAHTRVKILKSCQNISDLIRQYFESMYF